MGRREEVDDDDPSGSDSKFVFAGIFVGYVYQGLPFFSCRSSVRSGRLVRRIAMTEKCCERRRKEQIGLGWAGLDCLYYLVCAGGC